MFAFFATLIILSIIITLVQAAFGIIGSPNASQASTTEMHSVIFENEREIREEKSGLDDHGHGYYGTLR